MIAVLLCAIGVLGSAQPEPRMLAEADAAADVELLVGVMQDIHPGYTRYATAAELTAAERTLREIIPGGAADTDLYLAVARYLATIRCEHTEAEPPKRVATFRAANATMLPVAFDLVDGQAIITQVAPDVPGVRAGDRLVAINAVAIEQLLQELQPLISVDGFTDHTKAAIFAGADDVGLTTVDIFFPMIHGFDDAFDLEVAAPDGEVRLVRANAVDERESLLLRGRSTRYQNFGDDGAVVWRSLDPGSAYLRIETFVNYRTPVAPDDVYGPIFREIGASGAQRLIVDLRPCGGGSTDAMAGLMRHLITEPMRAGGPVRVKTFRFEPYRDHLSTWDERAFDMPADLFTPDGAGFYIVDPAVAGGAGTIEPAPDAWGGPLIVLVGPRNESGATTLIAELREARPMTIVGAATGGSAEGPTAGQIAFLTLPNSEIVVRVPLLWSRTSATQFEPGMGVQPDVVIRPTVADVRAGRDPVLDAARRMR